MIHAQGAGGIEGMNITVNGVPVEIRASAERTRGPEVSLNQRVTLSAPRNVIHATVWDAQGRTGSSTLTVERAAPGRIQSPGAGSPPAGEYRPRYARRVAAVVGINEYQRWPNLEGAASDARRVAAPSGGRDSRR